MPSYSQAVLWHFCYFELIFNFLWLHFFPPPQVNFKYSEEGVDVISFSYFIHRPYNGRVCEKGTKYTFVGLVFINWEILNNAVEEDLLSVIIQTAPLTSICRIKLGRVFTQRLSRFLKEHQRMTLQGCDYWAIMENNKIGKNKKIMAVELERALNSPKAFPQIIWYALVHI